MSLTHFTQAGEAHLVNVSGKAATARRAVAEGWIQMHPATLARIAQGGHEKGDVLAVARLAGIMGAKRTADLVPLCHPLNLSGAAIELTVRDEDCAVYCRATVETTGQTGVEMEALCAVQVSLLTIYDMCKACDRGMTIAMVRLLEKAGGNAGHWVRDPSAD